MTNNLPPASSMILPIFGAFQAELMVGVAFKADAQLAAVSVAACREEIDFAVYTYLFAPAGEEMREMGAKAESAGRVMPLLIDLVISRLWGRLPLNPDPPREEIAS